LAERFVRARDAAEGINDPRLRGQVLFEISAQQRRTGMAPEDAQASEARAIAAATAIPSVISRVWIHGDIATLHARSGENDRAWTAFDRAMAEARKIDNSWARARVMAKLAQTLIDLVTPKTAATADEMSKDTP
ncbi:MAG: hypothetical protein RIE16_03455, partial [Rhodospirillales bacterium]